MGTAYGVAVVYLGTITANDQDGETWRLLVNDGHNGGEIYATMSKSAIAEVGNVDAGMLCAAVEKRAGSYPERRASQTCSQRARSPSRRTASSRDPQLRPVDNNEIALPRRRRAEARICYAAPFRASGRSFSLLLSPVERRCRP